MAVAVFDADVLIAFLNHEDVHHDVAVERMRAAFVPGSRRLVSAVNYTEVLVGPLRTAGSEGGELVKAMFTRFGIETIQVDMALADGAAAVRARTNLKLPDAFAVATAVHASKRGYDEVRLESFDQQVVSAYSALGF
jgi:predicted nucleic acid-binding protein